MILDFVCGELLKDAMVCCQVESARERQLQRSSIARKQANVSELAVFVKCQSIVCFVPHQQAIPLYKIL
jgi:hypothetical protein